QRDHGSTGMPADTAYRRLLTRDERLHDPPDLKRAKRRSEILRLFLRRLERRSLRATAWRQRRARWVLLLRDAGEPGFELGRNPTLEQRVLELAGRVPAPSTTPIPVEEPAVPTEEAAVAEEEHAAAEEEPVAVEEAEAEQDAEPAAPEPEAPTPAPQPTPATAISDEGVAFIGRHEGFRGELYDDV